MELISAGTTPGGFGYPSDEDATRPAEVRAVQVSWPDAAWQPFARNGFTAIVGSRDPLDPIRREVPNHRAPVSKRIEATPDETLSGERLALVVRKHSGVPLSREEQARLQLLTEKLDGPFRVNTLGDGLAALNARFEEVDVAMRDLDGLLGFTRDDD